MTSSDNYKYGIKSTVSQGLAIVGAGFLQVGIGAQLICTTVIIGAVPQNVSSDNEDQLTMTTKEASWFGSLVYLCTPLGCVLSSLMLNRLGHKNCMIIANVPYLVSQVMFYFAEDVATMYACSIMMGLGVGFSGGPFSAYIGEVSEPKLRGSLMSLTNVFYFGGSLLFTTVYAITKQWRLTVLINMSIPIVTIVILFVSPDSPMWLLAKGKTEKAQRTLGKLRGWISHDKCLDEFQEMVIFASNNKSKNDKNDDHKSENALRQLFKANVLKPFRLILIYFFFSNLLSGVPYGPYLVNVFTKFGAKVDVDWTVAFSVALAIIAGVLTVFFVSTLGKRLLTLMTLSICSVCYIAVGLIGVYCIDLEKSNQTIISWITLILYLISTFMSSFGIMPISWILLSEIFPMKSRNITCSICSTLTFVFSFFMTKYYPDFVALVDFYNTFTIFGISGLIGCVYFYYYLPETENKTLQEISEFFK